MSFPLPCRVRRRSTDFSVEEFLGEGSLSVVHVAIEKTSGRRVALKIFDRGNLNRNKKALDVDMEEHALRRLNHPSIIKLYASFRDDMNSYLALELCQGGKELWEIAKDVGCPDRLARHYLSQVILAVQHLRDAEIVHRDLKAENVVVNHLGQTKLIDFGTAKDLAHPKMKGSGTRSFNRVLEEYVGTPNFMAPEVVNNKASDHRSDTWSLGCMFHQVLSGIAPFAPGSEYHIYKRVLRARLVPLPGMHSDACDLIARMVVLQPDLRLGVTSLLAEIGGHPYFSKATPGLEGGLLPHRRPVPVLSLEELCLQHLGRRWPSLGAQATARSLEVSLRSSSQDRCADSPADVATSVRAHVSSVFSRFDRAAEIRDWKGGEATPSSIASTPSADEDSDSERPLEDA